MTKDRNIFGEDDQELLLDTFALYFSRVTGDNQVKVHNIIRKSMINVTSNEGVDFKNTRYLTSEDRKVLVRNGIDEFISLMSIHQNLAKKIQEDCLIIYEHWKRYKRRNPTNAEVELYNFTKELRDSGITLFKHTSG